MTVICDTFLHFFLVQQVQKKNKIKRNINNNLAVLPSHDRKTICTRKIYNIVIFAINKNISVKSRPSTYEKP